MKNHLLIWLLIAIVILATTVTLLIVSADNGKNTDFPDDDTEPNETPDTEPDNTEPFIPIINEDNKTDNTVSDTEKADVILNVADYDNGHDDTPSVVGEVYINPGHKEDAGE